MEISTTFPTLLDSLQRCTRLYSTKWKGKGPQGYSKQFRSLSLSTNRQVEWTDIYIVYVSMCISNVYISPFTSVWPSSISHSPPPPPPPPPRYTQTVAHSKTNWHFRFSPVGWVWNEVQGNIDGKFSVGCVESAREDLDREPPLGSIQLDPEIIVSRIAASFVLSTANPLYRRFTRGRIVN